MSLPTLELPRFWQQRREKGCSVVDRVDILVQLAMQFLKLGHVLVPMNWFFQRAVEKTLGK